MSDKLDMIYDLLKADREEATDFRKEVRASHKETSDKLNKLETETAERLSKIELLDEQQNTQLAEHMRRTDILEKLHIDNQDKIKSNDDRITVLEEPGKVRRYIKNNIVTIAKVTGALMTIGAFVAWFMGLF